MKVFLIQSLKLAWIVTKVRERTGVIWKLKRSEVFFSFSLQEALTLINFFLADRARDRGVEEREMKKRYASPKRRGGPDVKRRK